MASTTTKICGTTPWCLWDITTPPGRGGWPWAPTRSVVVAPTITRPREGLAPGEGQVLELNASDAWSLVQVPLFSLTSTAKYDPVEEIGIATSWSNTATATTTTQQKTSGHAHSPQRPAWSGQGVEDMPLFPCTLSCWAENGSQKQPCRALLWASPQPGATCPVWRATACRSPSEKGPWPEQAHLVTGGLLCSSAESWSLSVCRRMWYMVDEHLTQILGLATPQRCWGGVVLHRCTGGSQTQVGLPVLSLSLSGVCVLFSTAAKGRHAS